MPDQAEPGPHQDPDPHFYPKADADFLQHFWSPAHHAKFLVLRQNDWTSQEWDNLGCYGLVGQLWNCHLKVTSLIILFGRN